MNNRKSLLGMASAALVVAHMGVNIPVYVRPSEPKKPPLPQTPTTKRAKTKAARKQRREG